MRGLDARLKRLEKEQADASGFVVLFGDDPVPENLPPGTRIFRFCEEDKGL